MIARYIFLHIIALIIGVITDWIIGDPYWLPHPIRAIGALIGHLDKSLMPEHYKPLSNQRRERLSGLLLCATVICSVIILMCVVVTLGYILSDITGVLVEAVFTAYILAAKSLRSESNKVALCLEAGDVEGARRAVSMIVGRDTDSLDEEGIARAAVETVAENTSDGVIAPLIYLIIGGPVLGMTYKAINTMDSMIGYHNDRYENFGFFAARLDDIVNFVPSRISALLMIAAGWIIGLFSSRYSASDGYRIWRRDRYNHKSPNSAQTESACAGILGIKLAGDAYYFGRLVKKPTMGDEKVRVCSGHIADAARLMYMAEVLCLLVTVVIIGIVGGMTLL